MKILKIFGAILFIALAGIQFFPARTNSGISGSADDFIVKYKVPENIGKELRSACYNCHSNHTNYPWYSRIQPVGWIIGSDIRDAKKMMNLSEFGTYSLRRQETKIESMIFEVENNEMPLRSYRLMHPEARLQDKDRKALTLWLRQLEDSL